MRNRSGNVLAEDFMTHSLAIPSVKTTLPAFIVKSSKRAASASSSAETKELVGGQG